MGRSLRSPVVCGLLVAAVSLGLAAPAGAAEPLPFASLTPADGDTFEATSVGGVEFAVAGGPGLAPISVLVSRSATMQESAAVDFVGLSATLTEAGAYRGLSGVGGWVTRPGTYYWQARATWSADGVSHAGLGPVRRIVVTKPSSALPIVTRSESRSAARSHLGARFSSYRHGHGRRMRCSRVSRMHIRCSVRWRFRDRRYTGRVEITASTDDELVAVSRIHRRI
jgi:hypothetical protein